MFSAVLAGLQRVLFGRQAESVVPHGVEHILSLGALVSSHHVGGDVTQGVSHVQSFARGVGEHVQQEILFFLRQVPGEVAAGVIGVEGAGAVPVFLPLFFQLPGQLRGVAVGWYFGFCRGVFGHQLCLFHPL